MKKPSEFLEEEMDLGGEYDKGLRDKLDELDKNFVSKAEIIKLIKERLNWLLKDKTLNFLIYEDLKQKIKEIK